MRIHPHVHACILMHYTHDAYTHAVMYLCVRMHACVYIIGMCTQVHAHVRVEFVAIARASGQTCMLH